MLLCILIGAFDQHRPRLTIAEVAEGGPDTTPAAKPKRVTKKAAAAVAEDAEATPVADGSVAEEATTPAKPKSVTKATKAKAVDADAEATPPAEGASTVETVTAAKPKGGAKAAKAAAVDADGTADGPVATAAKKPATKAKATAKAAPVPSGEVAS